MKIGNLIDLIKKFRPTSKTELIKEAYAFAAEIHKNQKRLSGEDYMQHPIAVAEILTSLGLDETTIAAGVLHDVLEESSATKEALAEKFNQKVADLVDGVTKLGEIDLSRLSQTNPNQRLDTELENLRKFILASAKDIRVVLIKLADRLHNMRTIQYLPIARQRKNAKETLEIFAPLADRLGMGEMKAELEDISFKILYPREYQAIAKELEETKKERASYVAKMKRIIIQELNKEGIEAKIDGRVKHFYSIYNKLKKVQGDFSKIYDLLAVRIIVNNVEDCYKALGIIHKNFKPLIYRIKDYIAVPKPNGYRSLQTTVFGADGKISEIQIRTKEMHDEAETGVAAHWYYSENKKVRAYRGKASFAPEKMNWVASIMSWQNDIRSDEEFAESLRIDLFNGRIFVFSPKGEIFELPDGSTPVDFAYEVHSEIGARCRGSKVNGKIVTLDHKLENRDMVEIMLAPKKEKAAPSRDWLEFVKTTKAKQRIRSHFKKLNRDVNITEGRKLLISELLSFGVTEGEITDQQRRDLISETGWKEWDDVLAAIGDGTVTTRQIIKKLIGQKIYIKKEKDGQVFAEGPGEQDSYSNLSGILVRYAACCRPKSGDDIKGYITRGQGITLHLSDCPNLLASDTDRIINVDFEVPNTAILEVVIEGENRLGFIRDVSAIISAEGVNINSISNDHPDEETSNVFLKLSLDSDKIADLIFKLKKVPGVRQVKKV